MGDVKSRFPDASGTQGKVLVTNGDGRVGLCILRSLAKRNVETILVVEGQAPLSSFSRYAKNIVKCTSPAVDAEAFLLSVRRLLRKNRYDALFPCHDTSLVLFSDHRDQLSPYVKLPMPSRESVRKVYDKSLTMRVAQEQGVPIPETYFVHNLAELKDVAGQVTFPAVIKPKWSVVWNRGKALYRRPSYVNSVQELLSSYEAIHQYFPFPMVQEYVPGQNIDVAVIVNNGEPKAACCFKEHRTIPVTGGNTVFRETVQPEPKIMKYVFEMLRKLEWHGVAEVEFKIDERDSAPKLMEINGRFWASLQLAVDSGIDFPYLLYRLAIDGEIRPTFNYDVGVKERWVNGDVYNLLSVLSGKPRISTVHPSRVQAILRFLKIYENDMHYDNFAIDDAAPFFVSLYEDASARLFHVGSKRTLADPGNY